MNKTIENNVIKIEIIENFAPMLAYMYLMVIDFASNDLFVPSINPPSDGNYLPKEDFFNKEHIIEYNKKVVMFVEDKTIILRFQTIEDAELFLEEIEKSW